MLCFTAISQGLFHIQIYYTFEFSKGFLAMQYCFLDFIHIGTVLYLHRTLSRDLNFSFPPRPLHSVTSCNSFVFSFMTFQHQTHYIPYHPETEAYSFPYLFLIDIAHLVELHNLLLFYLTLMKHHCIICISVYVYKHAIVFHPSILFKFHSSSICPSFHLLHNVGDITQFCLIFILTVLPF